MIKFLTNEDRLKGVELIKKHHFGRVDERTEHSFMNMIGLYVPEPDNEVDPSTISYHVIPGFTRILDEHNIKYEVTMNCR